MELLRPLLANRPPAELEKIERAYVFARDAHAGVLRKSGEPYIIHPVAVATILAELGMDTDAICAGFLHDTVEDVDWVTFEIIEEQFDVDVRRIVEGETKVSKISKMSNKDADEQAENLRQMLIAMTGDIRIIIVKLADRLHNMRTMMYQKPEKQQRISRETIEIYAPLAHRLGIGQIKWELEDLCFQYLEPQAYQYLKERLSTRQEERDEQIRVAIEQLRAELLDDPELPEWIEDINITGRSKHLWSIHTKMKKEGKALEQIFDLRALRLILTPKPVVAPEGRAKERSEDAREKRVCYHSLGLVHSMWSPIPGRFKDYIAVPKPNGYQSLHTTVISLGGQPIEVQIRSRRMHDVAEYGVAAHWMYKQGAGLASRSREDWMNQLRELQHNIPDASDFVDAVKSDLLGGRVYVLTPKGDPTSLPQGATAIDFAYYVHTRVGDTTIGARVNGSIVPLNYTLRNGDIIEIVTNKSSKPSRDWLNFAITRSARTKIRHYFSTLERKEALEHGHDLLERYLRKRQLPVRQLMRTKLLEEITEKLLNSRNPDDLYLALHVGKVNASAVARLLAPQLEQERRAAVPLAPSSRTDTTGKVAKAITATTDKTGVYVEGMADMPTKLANCCSPIRGDQLMGYLTRARGVTIHRLDCPNMVRLLKSEPERCISASWTLQPQGDVVVDIEVVAQDRAGLLNDILAVLAAQKHSSLKVGAEVTPDEMAHIALRLAVPDQNALMMVAHELSKVENVQDVLRVGRTNRSLLSIQA